MEIIAQTNYTVSLDFCCLAGCFEVLAGRRESGNAARRLDLADFDL